MERSQTLNKKSVDMVLVFVVLLLLLIGFFMVYSSSYPDGYYNYEDSLFFLKKQVLAGLAGVIAMILISYIPYTLYRKLTKLMLGVSIALSLATVLFGKEGNGATRWLIVAGVSIQPSEIVKIVAVLCMADFFDKRRNKLSKFREGFVVSIIGIVVFVALILIQKDLSTSIVLAMVLFIMFFVAGAKFWHIAIMGILAVAALIPLISMYAYRIERIVCFLDPFKYKQTTGWQLVQSLYALGTGGLFGLGLGKSRQKFFYLPEAYNDFIFSIIGEELGFFGCLAVIVLFVLFAWRGLRIAMNSKNFYGSLVAVGLTSLVLVQFLLHVAVATSSVPPTGRALPFISAGGTSILFLLASIGILLNISKSADIYIN